MGVEVEDVQRVELIGMTSACAGVDAAQERFGNPNTKVQYVANSQRLYKTICTQALARGSSQPLSNSADVQDLCTILSHCYHNIGTIDDTLHDLWTASTSLTSSRPGVKTEETIFHQWKGYRTHALMKPLSEFSQDELKQEHALAQLDLLGFIKIISGNSDNIQQYAQDIDGKQVSQIADAACALLYDAEFIIESARSNHNNWIKVKQEGFCGTQPTDSRTNDNFDNLSDTDQKITIRNVIVDWLAVINYLFEMEDERIISGELAASTIN